MRGVIKTLLTIGNREVSGILRQAVRAGNSQIVEGGGSSFIELPKPIYRNASALLVTVTDWAEYREPSKVATILTSVPTPKRLVASVREGSK